MGLFDKLRGMLRSRNVDPLDAPRLSGESVNALAVSIAALPVGKRGWITLREASRLFSQVVDDEEAFGEQDDEGRKRLEEFAAENPYQSDFSYMPVEGRL